MAQKAITVLGSTGSIGSQTLDVCRFHGIGVRALSANTNAALLERQAREFSPETVSIGTEEGYRDLKLRLADTGIRVLFGEEGLCETARLSADLTVNAVVGMVGLRPTLAAIEAGNTVGLANKETMVVGGSLVTEAAKKRGVSVLPIDSEHSAIFQSLLGAGDNKIEKILLTASGGPFFGYTKERLREVTREQALRHPNWSMGQKITTDSATLMNKGLELIEAVWFFGVRPEQVEILVHRQSILHSAVEFEDGAVIGQLGCPDMKIPIQFAITYPKRFKSAAKPLSLTEIGTLTFERADEEAFPCLSLAKKAISEGGNAPCILNTANEAAVAAFLRGELPFYRIAEIVAETLAAVPREDRLSLSVIEKTEREANEAARERIAAAHACLN